MLEAWRTRGVGAAPDAVGAAQLGVELGRSDDVRAVLEHVTKTGAWIDAARAIARGELVAGGDELERIGTVPDEADIRLLAARALVEQGRRAEADVQLQRALALYRSLGAARYVRKAETLLAATG
jgi:hypothetical protein